MDRNFDNVKFEFEATYEKAWQDGKTGKMYVRAVASDDQLDLQRDKMGQLALNKMVAASKKGVPFLSTHRDTFEFGKTVDGEIVEVKEGGKSVRKFFTTIELDSEYPQSRTLFKEVASGDCKRQLSIGGKLNLKNKDAVSIEMTPSGLARTINDLDLDHIAATREKHAANPRTSFMEAIAKSLDEAEKDGWVGEVSKAVESVAVAPESASDVKAGMSFLAKLGRLLGVTKETEGGPMNTATAKPEKTEKTDKAEKVEPAPASDTTTPVSSSDTTTEKTAVKAVAESKFSAKKAEETNVHDLVNDIAILLAKRAKAYASGDSECMTVKAETDRSAYNALWTVRALLAKAVTGAELGAGEQQAVSTFGDGSLYAPRDLSAAKVSGAYLPDKAPAGADTNVAATAVSDARRNIQVGGEVKSTAPSAPEAMKQVMSELDRAAKLPQASEGMKWQGIAKDTEAQNFFKSMMEEVLEKSTGVQKEMVLAAFEKVAEEQQKGIAEVNKSVENLGAALNTVSGELADSKARVAKLEKSGGVSHSGPRGAVDSTVAPPKTAKGGVWTGMFAKPRREALNTYGD